MKKTLLFKVVVLVFAFVGLISVANAQVTTSSANGTIRDAQGPLPGASIKAVHTPTGTVYSLTTNADGRFNIGNMRVGGPYTFEVTFVGFNPQKITDIYLKLGESYVLNVTLADNSANLKEVTVKGTPASGLLNSNRNGATTVINRSQIQNLPTITRSINDITRLTPQGGGPNGSLAGGNYRSNNFTVDGSNFNNQFGIGANVPANGAPISIDALEQISVNITPYDVRQSGFTGGAVNAVTRSGSNDFTATAFYTMRGESEQGKKIGDYTITNVLPFDQKQYGASFGGPIIKNKLFFFLNAEFNKQLAPGQNRVAATTAAPFGLNDNIARPTATFLNDVRSTLLSRYGYDPGVYEGYSYASNNDKLLARIDWNISKDHNFTIRYNQVESKTPSSVSGSRSPLSSYATGSGRTDKNALWFSNSNYLQEANLYSVAAELNSRFGSRFSNVLRGSWTHQNDPRSSTSTIFPFVDILDGSGVPLTSFGYEPFTSGNLRDVKTYSITDNLTGVFGKHTVTLGGQADFSTTKNGFQRFATSYYTFNSWNDFINNQKPRDFAITYSLTPGYEQAFPSFKFNQYSAYIQDEVALTDRFKFSLGLRAERATYPSIETIKTHPLIAPLNFLNGEKVDTGQLPESNIIYSPRFGFNWDIMGDRSVQLRGGSGIFRGTVPFVWVVAQSGDAGLLQFTQTYVGQANTPGPFNPDPKAYLPATAPAAGTSIPNPVSATAANFKQPKTWKSNLAVDFRLPGGIVATLEGLYNRDLNAAIARNVNLVNPTPLNIAGYADNRVFYPSNNRDKFVNPLTSAGLPVANGNAAGSGAFNAIVLDNAKGGYYWSGTAQLTKQFQGGLSAMVAYTHSDGRNYGDGAGDQLINLWSIPQTAGNPNDPTLSYTGNIIPDRIIASVSYRKEYLRNLATTISAFYSGSIQDRFSYTYSSDFNRDGQTNDLIYIPRSPSEITFVPIPAGQSGYGRAYSAQEQSDAFFAYVDQDKYLSAHKGSYAERNGATMPWLHRVDLKIIQEVFRNVGGKKNSFQFTADIFNFGNLLNKKWGTLQRINNSSVLVPWNPTPVANGNASGASNTNNLTVGGANVPTFRLAPFNGDIIRSSFSDNQTISSTYYMQFGVRYNFN
jgi:outer membrane receptor protein involved in Fe transport